jgi:hypothetical protein
LLDRDAIFRDELANNRAVGILSKDPRDQAGGTGFACFAFHRLVNLSAAGRITALMVVLPSSHARLNSSKNSFDTRIVIRSFVIAMLPPKKEAASHPAALGY